MGVGKTVLVSTIIQALIENDNLRNGCLVAYFYRDGKSQHLSNTSTMLRSLLRQLGAFEICFQSLKTLWSKTPKPLLDDNRVLSEIHKVIRSTPTILPLDGIDEAKQGYHAAAGLINLARQSNPFLRIVVSGREPHTVPQGLVHAETLNLESISARQNISLDICRFVDLRVSNVLHGQSYSIQKRVKEWVKDNANNV